MQITLNTLNDRVDKLQTAVNSISTAGGSAGAVPEEVTRLPDPPSGMITAQFIYTGFTGGLQGLTVETHKPGPNAVHWATISLKPGQEEGPQLFPLQGFEGKTFKASDLVGPLYNDGGVANVAFLKPGSENFVVFVAKNSADIDQQFSIVPHLYQPLTTETGGNMWDGVVLQCWCVGLTYPIAAGGEFVRVVKVIISPDIPAGTKVIVNHPVFGVE